MLQRNVPMLLWRIAVAFVLQHLQRVNQAWASIRGHDHIINEAAPRSHVRVSELLTVQCDEFSFLRHRVCGFGKFAAEDDAHGTIWPHDRNLGGGPCQVKIAAYMLAAHYIISATVGFPCDNGELGYRCFAIGVQEFGARTNDAPVFLLHTGHETRDIFKGDDRNVEAITEA